MTDLYRFHPELCDDSCPGDCDSCPIADWHYYDEEQDAEVD